MQYHCTRIDGAGHIPHRERGDWNPWWEDYYDAERWRHIVKRGVDTSMLPLLGHFSRTGEWDDED
jgi:hypothetical protein